MRNRTTIATLIAGLTLGVAAHAAEPVSQPQSTNADLSPSVVVARDPATGQLRAPTAAEMQALQAKQRQMPVGKSSARPRTEADAARTKRVLSNGATRVQVPESLMSSMVATRQADGSLRISHADEAGHATAVEQEPTK